MLCFYLISATLCACFLRFNISERTMYFILLVLITLGGVTLRSVIVNVLALVDKWIHIIRLIRYTFSITPAKIQFFFDICKCICKIRF